LLDSPGISCRLLSTESQTRQCLQLAERLHLYVGWPLGDRRGPPPSRALTFAGGRASSLLLRSNCLPFPQGSRPAPHMQTPPPVRASHCSAAAWEHACFCFCCGRACNYTKEERTHSFVVRCAPPTCIEPFGDKGGRRKFSRFTHRALYDEFASPQQGDA
jgi:hypothetical protein